VPAGSTPLSIGIGEPCTITVVIAVNLAISTSELAPPVAIFTI